MSLPPALALSLDLSTIAVLADELAHRIGGVKFDDPTSRSTPWMTTREAADYLRIGVSELHRLAAAGAIPHEQDGGPGGRLFFHAADLDAWRRSGGRRSCR